MIWKLTVLDASETDLLFVGNSADKAEIEACAAEASRMRPEAVVLITSPFGDVTRVNTGSTIPERSP